jgi:hypothetical protein
MSRQEDPGGDVCVYQEAMLRASKLPEVLGGGLQDGIYGAVLMTSDGSVICSNFLPGSILNETSLAAISSSVWGNYTSGTSHLPHLCL